MARSGGHLRAADADDRRRQVALTELVAAAAHVAAFAPERDNVVRSGANLRVVEDGGQRRR